MRIIALTVMLLLAILLEACGGDQDPKQHDGQTLRAEPKVTQHPAYGSIGSGPIVVLLHSGMNTSLYDNGTTAGMPSALVSAGFTVISLDLPCHGDDAPTSGPTTLACWAQRIHDGDDEIFLRFCAGLSDVLDDLNAHSAAIVGISRGAYVATTCAAYEPRFTRIVQEIPVIDLNSLDEFRWAPAVEDIFNLQQYLPYLEDRQILLSIDHADTRVGTDIAITFGHEEGAEVIVTPYGDHILTAADSAYAAQWLLDHPWNSR